MLMSERAAETRRRSMTVPPPPSKGRRVTTSLSFRTVRPCWAIVARRGAAAPREALGALCADQSGWCLLKSPATSQCCPGGMSKSLRRRSARFVSYGAPLYTEVMRRGQWAPSVHSIVRITEQMSCVSYCFYLIYLSISVTSVISSLSFNSVGKDRGAGAPK